MANRNEQLEVYASAAPTEGNWVRNDRVWNSHPSADAPVGWVCVAGGSPGTWVPFGHAVESPQLYQYRDFVVAGTLTAAAGAVSYPFPVAATILGVSATVGTAPVGEDLLIDVNINGTTIFTTQDNRLTIDDGETTSLENTLAEVTAIEAGDVVSVDVDQIGDDTAGSDLVVTVRYR